MTDSTSARALPGGPGRLGDLTVARIGYGVMQLAERRGQDPVAAPDAVALLRRAVELGVTHFDTAAFYGQDVANSLLREALHPFADDVVIATKVGARREPHGAFGLTPAQRPAELRSQVEQNLSTLGVDRLGVVNLRRADVQPGILATGDQVVPLDDQLAELIALRDAGSIAGIGLSHVSEAQLTAALPAGIVCVQNQYSLVDRSAESLLALCRANGIAWAPFFPLGSGFPGTPKVTGLPAVETTAERLGATPAQVGLAWLLAHADDILLIPGTGMIAHLEENVAAGSVILDAAAMAALDAS
jgi:aryl-alcohol dehydrogenase-like predicted oxidoreductase